MKGLVKSVERPVGMPVVASSAGRKVRLVTCAESRAPIRQSCNRMQGAACRKPRERKQGTGAVVVACTLATCVDTSQGMMDDTHLDVAAEEDIDGDHAGRHQRAHVQGRQVALHKIPALNSLPSQGATHELLAECGVAALA